jgi:hypothetical protein
MANNPPLYNKNVPFAYATIADTVGNGFQPRYLPQQTPSGTSQYSANSPLHVMDDQSSLSQDKILKIQELKKLLNKYPKYYPNPEEKIKWAVYWSVNGDNKILDENLEHLRLLDSLANRRF